MVRVVARNAVLICAIEILLMDEVTTVSCRKATRIVLERAPHKLDLSPILMRGGKIQIKRKPVQAGRHVFGHFSVSPLTHGGIKRLPISV